MMMTVWGRDRVLVTVTPIDCFESSYAPGCDGLGARAPVCPNGGRAAGQ